MSTRTPLPISVVALLAVLPAAPILAQAPAAPAPAAAAAPSVADRPAAPAADAVAAPAPDAAATPAPAGAVVAAPAAAASATKGKDAAGRDTLSVDFPDFDIREILRNVADLFELNIIMPDTLQGKTTIKLRDVTWRQIFDSVLKPVGFTYIEEGNIVKIVSNDSLLQEPTSTEVFLINYARAADILPTITSLVDAAAGGKIVVDARSNSLVITERPSRMNRIRPIIEQLDRATDQVMIESKFVEVTSSDLKNIGVNWASLANVGLSAGPFNGNFNRTRDQTGSDGFNANRGNTRDSTNATTSTNTTTINNGQNGGSNNTTTVTSGPTGPVTTSTTGTTGALTNSTTVATTNGTNNSLTDTVTDAFNQVASLVNNTGTNRSMTAVFSATQFSVVLSALQQLQKTKIVSNPTIVTLNNTQAQINVGEERPIPTFTYNQQQGTYEVSGFNYKPIGIILKVTPQVNNRGTIKLTVDPEVSQSTGTADFRGAAIPIVATRRASTTVQLKDGYTMGIGGLMQTTSSGRGNRVPILGSVPVLGRLFRSDERNEAFTNLIIFITAKTVSADGAPVEQLFDSERVRQLDLRREDLPGYRDGSNPFVTPAVQPAKK